MSEGSVQLTLYVGKVVPSRAPAALVNALQQAEVDYDRTGPCVCNLSFNAERQGGAGGDFTILANNWLQTSFRLILSLTLQGKEQVLMDGIITNLEVNHQQGAGGGPTLSVTVEDLGALMDLIDIPLEYPAMSDYVIAGLVLGKYLVFGILPLIIPTLSAPVSNPLSHVQVQSGTDRCFLAQIAEPHGYVLRVIPGPVVGTSTAYWGPPYRFGLPQKALTLDMGPASNVSGMTFGIDAHKPTLVHGLAETDYIEGPPVPLMTLRDIHLQTLAKSSLLWTNQPFVKNAQMEDPRLGYAKAYYQAQVMTNNSTADAVTASGTVDGLRYGAILQTPGIVAVRGAGETFDGEYYVMSVKHTLARGSYKQQFSLAREGTGSLLERVQV